MSIKGILDLHITSWALLIVLFVLAVVFFKSNPKRGKMFQMILRVLYLFVIGSGVWMFMKISQGDLSSKLTTIYNVKMLCGLFVIGFVEMTLAKLNKGKSVTVFLSISVIVILLTLFLGYSLPLGQQFFDFLTS